MERIILHERKNGDVRIRRQCYGIEKQEIIQQQSESNNNMLLLTSHPTLSLYQQVEVFNCPSILTLSTSTFKNLRVASCNHLQNISNTVANDIDIINCRNLESIANTIVHSISITSCPNISDITALSRIQSVTLSACSGIFSIDCLLESPSMVEHLEVDRCKNAALTNFDYVISPSLSSFSCDGLLQQNAILLESYSHLRTLKVTNCEIQDPRVECLAGLYHVTLSNWPYLVDVSSLGSIYELSLSNCTAVSDASALGLVHDLNLAGTSVVDVSALGTVHTLNISSTAVTDISALETVHTLNISNCRNILKVPSSVLKKCYKVILST